MSGKRDREAYGSIIDLTATVVRCALAKSRLYLAWVPFSLELASSICKIEKTAARRRAYFGADKHIVPCKILSRRVAGDVTL